MTLSTRLTLKTAVLILALLVVACVSLLGLNGLNRDLDRALGEYEELRATYEFANTVERARVVLMTDPDNVRRLGPLVQRAIMELDRGELALDAELAAQLKGDLTELDDAIVTGAYDRPRQQELADLLTTAMNRLTTQTDGIEDRIKRIGERADAKRRATVRLVAMTAGVAALLAVLVGLWQHRAVMTPLKNLGSGVNRLARGDFVQRITAGGDREFARLGEDFNRMAEELETLYHGLEEKVRLRSAQLAQSERLASVGFLAAGVAHEINNPLGIIAGEAELALSGMKRDGTGDDDQRAALTAIRDEAFRCKDITQKLLSLARPGGGERRSTDLHALAGEVASLVRSLPQHTGREVVVRGASEFATTDPAQVKQVLLNLVINAMEATPPDLGERSVIVVSARAEAGRAMLSVADRGKGMDRATLGRVFEPFFTSKRTPTTPGLGLGLSISHAIIADLGGELTADSPGDDRGSTFTIALPAG